MNKIITPGRNILHPILGLFILFVLSCGEHRESKSKTMGTNNGLVRVESDYNPDQTMDRVEQLLRGKGYHIFTKIDHAASAKKHGRDLRPTQVIIFGNPDTGGTKLMQENQSIAIDLPAKILVWEDEGKTTHIAYSDMQWIADRHQLSTKNKEVINTLNADIGKVCKTAAKGEDKI